MSWVTVLWSLAAGLSLALAGMHLLIWFQDRRAWASLALAATALAATWHGATELMMMYAVTPESWGHWVRLAHLGSFTALAGSMIFVQLYLGTGRRWLLVFTIGLRFVTLVVNFSIQPNVNYDEIHSLRQIPFLGEQVSIVGEAVINPWMWVAQFCFLLWFVFVVDAAIRLWRRGPGEGRRRALFAGGSIALFVLFGTGQAILSLNRVIDAPIIASQIILLMVLAMGYQLSRDVLRAARLARELRVTEQRLSLAASAARIVLWEWRVDQDNIWASGDGPNLFAATPDQPLSFQYFRQTLHPDDRDQVLQVIRHAVDHRGTFATEYRRLMPDGSIRWIAGSGTAELDPASGVTLMRGVSLDITERRKTEDEILRQRSELAHLSRVASLGELSGSLAHEINQPLAIILSNAQAAQRLLAQDPPDLPEVRDILADIINADRRAGEVIKRLRALLKHGESEQKVLSIKEVIDEVLALMRSDLMARGVSVVQEAPAEPPRISGDHIPLQQVFLNLFTNACDAMTTNPAGKRRLTITTQVEGSLVRVLIRDMGCGLPSEAGRIFEPFFTTKSHGLGMGLPICRTIISAHGGRLWAEPNLDRGATFFLELPIREAAA